MRNAFLLIIVLAFIPAWAVTSEDCLVCHSDPALTGEKDGKTRSLFTDSAVLRHSVHAAAACTDCHAGFDPDNLPHAEVIEPVQCVKCHLGNPGAVKKAGDPSRAFIGSYETSVHGMAVKQGNRNAAGCGDCHGTHDIRKGSDIRSGVSKTHIAETCGKCHADIAKTYGESIHGAALARGSRDAPSCTDCHGEHQILSPKDPNSRVAARNVSAQVCADCHNSVRLSAKFGLPKESFQTFSDSYHGLASKGGSVTVANCASCHGVHNIKPSSDSTSTISKARLAETCGHCHPGTNKNWTKGDVHVNMVRSENPILYWIRVFYISLIFLTIGGMSVHNFFDFLRKLKRQRAIRAGLIPAPKYSPNEYERLTLIERIQHAALFISFTMLVVTGFMLKFPDAWWVAPLRHISERAFDVRGLLHRIAAVVMVLASLYHLGYLAFTKRGRQLAKDMLPRIKDMRDALGLFLYNMGIAKTKPLFDRFGYIEKAEYWALIWGTAIMTITGIVMWFDNTFIGLFTKLGWDIARTIHYYEAWLATLAIVVWHFYFVIFNLDAYPMNTAWFTGKITEEMMEEEHPLELKRIKSEHFNHLED